MKSQLSAILLGVIAAREPPLSFDRAKSGRTTMGSPSTRTARGCSFTTELTFGSASIRSPVAPATARRSEFTFILRRIFMTGRTRGIALAVSDDAASELARDCILERPKVIFNARTGKFVMWFHLEPKGAGYQGARSGVAVADRPTGPYRFQGSLRPNAGVWPENVLTDLKQPLTPAELATLQQIDPARRPVALLSQGQKLSPGFCDRGKWRAT